MSELPQTPCVVAIDGPAGSGKSSVSRQLATCFDWSYLDTGAVYRSFAWYALQCQVDPGDEKALVALCESFDYRCAFDPSDATISVGETEVQDIIRGEEISRVVSIVAQVARVRSWINTFFRAILSSTVRSGIVVEGRDITTVVAPDAQVRILLTADAQVRIKRRAKQLRVDDSTASHVLQRDLQDRNVANFEEAAEGVFTLDTTELDFIHSVEACIFLVKKQTGKEPVKNV